MEVRLYCTVHGKAQKIFLLQLLGDGPMTRRAGIRLRPQVLPPRFWRR